MGNNGHLDVLEISYGHSDAWVMWTIGVCLAIAFFISVVVLPLMRKR
jgi:hypothetical protein